MSVRPIRRRRALAVAASLAGLATLGVAAALATVREPPPPPEGSGGGLPGLDLSFGWKDAKRLLDLHPPAWVERWLYNPRERTARGLERLEESGPGEALGAFETALRISPDEPAVLFNAGSARLLAGRKGAVEVLERSLDGAGPEPPEGTRAAPLAPELLQPAWYNLGVARLAAEDAAGAVDAFEQALRLEPGDDDAKHNLELALRRLEDERKLSLLPPEEAPGGDRPGEEDRTERGGGAEPDPAEQDEDRSGRDPGGTEAAGGPDGGPGAPSYRRQLPDFEEQEDLTAAEAAALLEAVKTLERLERHLQATRAARRTGAEEEDW